MSGGIDTLRLTAEEATGLLERGELTAAELHGAYLDAPPSATPSSTATSASSRSRPATASRSRSRT